MKLTENLFTIIVNLFKYSFGHFVGDINEIYFYHFGHIVYFQMFILHTSSVWGQEIMKCSVKINNGKIEITLKGNIKKNKEELLSKYSKLDNGETFFKYEDE